MADTETPLGITTRAINYHEQILYIIDLITCTGGVTKSRIRWKYRYYLRALYVLSFNKTQATTVDENHQAHFNRIHLLRWHLVAIEGMLECFREAEQKHVELLDLNLRCEQSLTQTGAPIFDQEMGRRRAVRALGLEARQNLFFEMLDSVSKLARSIEKAGDQVFAVGHVRWRFTRSFVC